MLLLLLCVDEDEGVTTVATTCVLPMASVVVGASTVASLRWASLSSPARGLFDARTDVMVDRGWIDPVARIAGTIQQQVSWDSTTESTTATLCLDFNCCLFGTPALPQVLMCTEGATKIQTRRWHGLHLLIALAVIASCSRATPGTTTPSPAG